MAVRSLLALLLALLASAPATAEPAPGQPAWSRLLYEASTTLASGDAEILLESVDADGLAEALIPRPEDAAGTPPAADDARLLTTTISIRPFGKTFRTETWYRAEDGAGLQRRRDKVDKEGSRKVWRYDAEGVHRLRADPKDRAEARLPPEDWTDRRHHFFPYGPNVEDCPVPSDPGGPHRPGHRRKALGRDATSVGLRLQQAGPFPGRPRARRRVQPGGRLSGGRCRGDHGGQGRDAGPTDPDPGNPARDRRPQARRLRALRAARRHRHLRDPGGAACRSRSAAASADSGPSTSCCARPRWPTANPDFSQRWGRRAQQLEEHRRVLRPEAAVETAREAIGNRPRQTGVDPPAPRSIERRARRPPHRPPARSSGGL